MSKYNYPYLGQGRLEKKPDDQEIIIDALEFYLELAGHFEDYGKRDQAREALKRINE